MRRKEEISFWAKNQKEIRFLAFFVLLLDDRSPPPGVLCVRLLLRTTQRRRATVCTNRSARAQRPGDASWMHRSSSQPVRRDAPLGVLRAEERRRDDERDDDVTVLSLSKVSHKISFENRPKPPPTKKGEKRKTKDVPMRTTRRWWPR